jgi:hypothetical protein
VRSNILGLAASLLLLSCPLACGLDPGAPPEPGSVEQPWDSADGNFTHPTHSYLAEAAIERVAPEYPEVRTYKTVIVKGANLELHERRLRHNEDDGDRFEALRVEIGGNNWAADRPGLLWHKARASYAAGDRDAAYLYVGILLHYVQDMGVPAHAFHVIHQSSFGKQDHFELQCFFKWQPRYESIDRADPAFEDPTDYVQWSGDWAAAQFTATYPGATYERRFFDSDASKLSDTDWRFIRDRQGQTVMANTWALRAAAKAFAAMRLQIEPLE